MTLRYDLNCSVDLFKSKRVECKYIIGKESVVKGASSNLKEWNVNEIINVKLLQ